MGIFSDRCEALVDSATGRCLSGAALEKAKQDRKWPRCGNKVKKAARFCNKCGSAAPGGWAKCSSCGKWIGVESEFCWNCSTALHPEDRNAMSDGSWQKAAGLLAKRLDVGDVKQFLHKGKILVGEGSSAILLQGGRFKDLLEAGAHTAESLASRINHWGDPPPSTAVLVDSGDVVIALRVEDLRTSEDIPVELYAEMAIRMVDTGKHAQAFMQNIMKDARELKYSDLTELLRHEVRYAVVNVCNTSTVGDLFTDPDRRLHLEAEMERVLKAAEDRFGFTLIRVSAAEFTGPAYEKLRAANGDLELKRRQMEFDRKMRDLLASDRMTQFKSEQDLDEYVTQMAHERDIRDTHRDQEIALLQQVQRHELDAQAAGHRMDAEMTALGHDLDLERTRRGFGREQELEDAKHGSTLKDIHRGDKVKDAETDLKVRKMEAEQELEETDKWLEIKRKKEEMRVHLTAEEERLRVENKARLIQALKGLTTEELLAVIDDRDQRADLLELRKQALLEGRGEREILALMAEKSPKAADALAQMAGLQRDDLERMLDERKAVYDDSTARDERLMGKALDAMKDAAKGKGGDTTTQIIK